MKKILIVFAGVVFLLSGCAGFDKKNTQKMPMVDPSNKVSESFFAKTKLTKNFTKEKSESGDISINKLEIVDDRTLLNGMGLYSEEVLDNVKIKILPCSEMPLKPNKNVLGDCFEINPGTSYKFSKNDFLVFPQKIFKDIDDVNFGYSEDEGGVYLNHFVNPSTCQDCGDDNFYTGDYIDNDKKYFSILNSHTKKDDTGKFYVNDDSYFNGYYYISYKDRKKRLKEIEDKFGIYIKHGCFEKNGKIFVRNGENKLLLKNVSPDGFDIFYIGNGIYVKDKNAIFLLEHKYESCGYHACALKNINTIKIKDIKNKSFSIYDEEKQIVKIDDSFYVLTDESLYEVDVNNPRFIELLKLDYILSNDKIIYLPHNRVLEDVDATTLKFIGGDYFADKNNIYIYGKKRKLEFKFDYDSLWASESGLLKDKNGVYMPAWVGADTFVQKNDLINDLASFEKIACKYRGCCFKDKNKVYYHWGDRDYFEDFSADAKTFEYIENMIAKDKNYLYDGLDIVEGVDIKSFKKIGYYSNFVYFKDKYSYYKSTGTWIKKVNKKDVPLDKLKDKKQ